MKYFLRIGLTIPVLLIERNYLLVSPTVTSVNNPPAVATAPKQPKPKKFFKSRNRANDAFDSLLASTAIPPKALPFSSTPQQTTQLHTLSIKNSSITSLTAGKHELPAVPRYIKSRSRYVIFLQYLPNGAYKQEQIVNENKAVYGLIPGESWELHV